MTSPQESPRGRPPRAIVVAFATVSFLALAVFGLGCASLVLDRDVVAIAGGGQVPGIAGMLLAVAVFAGALALTLRAPRPTLWSAPVVAIAVWLADGAGLLLGALAAGVDAAAAVAGAGGSVVGWFGVVVAGCALVCAWAAIALGRTKARRPRWRWEGDDEE